MPTDGQTPKQPIAEEVYGPSDVSRESSDRPTDEEAHGSSDASSPSLHSKESPRTQNWKQKALQLKPVRRIAYFFALSWCQTQQQESAPPRTWQTTFIRFGPLSGIAAMCLTVASLVASLGILAGSDQQPVADWESPPSTYIAIFTAIANLSVRYAAIQGVVIAWWIRASKGSTLAKLHWDWRAGTTLRGAVTAGRHTGLLALACIFSVIVVIDGECYKKLSVLKMTVDRCGLIPLRLMLGNFHQVLCSSGQIQLLQHR